MNKLEAFKRAYEDARRTKKVQPSCLIALSEAFPEATDIRVDHVDAASWEARVKVEGNWFVMAGTTSIGASETLVERYES